MKLQHIEKEPTEGFELIDPDFVQLIELSLLAMTDYASNSVKFEKNAGMRLIKNSDIERAEQILVRIADWFETSMEGG